MKNYKEITEGAKVVVEASGDKKEVNEAATSSLRDDKEYMKVAGDLETAIKKFRKVLKKNKINTNELFDITVKLDSFIDKIEAM